MQPTAQTDDATRVRRVAEAARCRANRHRRRTSRDSQLHSRNRTVPQRRREVGTVGLPAEVTTIRVVTVTAPLDSTEDWCELTSDELPIPTIYDWCVRPECGAVVLFSGTVRDHAADNTGEVRDGVTHLTYEAYDEQVIPRLQAIATAARSKFPGLGRIAMLHRVGRLELRESSVVCAVSCGHRGQAFEAARYCIDTLKEAVPIWKHESWEDGHDWGLGAHPITDVQAR